MIVALGTLKEVGEKFKSDRADFAALLKHIVNLMESRTIASLFSVDASEKMLTFSFCGRLYRLEHVFSGLERGSLLTLTSIDAEGETEELTQISFAAFVPESREQELIEFRSLEPMAQKELAESEFCKLLTVGAKLDGLVGS